MRLDRNGTLARRLGWWWLAAACSCGLMPLCGDVVETNDGSTIHGQVSASEKGYIMIDTDFAGTIAIAQDHVKAIVTQDEIHVALASGNTLKGRIEAAPSGIRIVGDEGPLEAQADTITALWRDADKSPAEKAAEALRRKWGYEMALDLNGRNGNSDRTFLGLSGRAVLEGPKDRLLFYANYARADENDEIAQDEGKTGVDYSNFFSGRLSWYVRGELGYDHTKALDLRSQSAVGMGYSFIKKEDHKLEARFGLNYRTEDYSEPAGEDFESVGIDLGVLHTLSTHWGRLTQSLTITPSFEDFSNYVVSHDSALELPVAKEKLWHLRVGLKTDYTSDPPTGFEKLDWTYYSQLVLSWK